MITICIAVRDCKRNSLINCGNMYVQFALLVDIGILKNSLSCLQLANIDKSVISRPSCLVMNVNVTVIGGQRFHFRCIYETGATQKLQGMANFEILHSQGL